MLYRWKSKYITDLAFLASEDVFTICLCFLTAFYPVLVYPFILVFMILLIINTRSSCMHLTSSVSSSIFCHSSLLWVNITFILCLPFSLTCYSFIIILSIFLFCFIFFIVLTSIFPRSLNASCISFTVSEMEMISSANHTWLALPIRSLHFNAYILENAC